MARCPTLTSAEEYPDEEYLDMSKSSSLQKNKQEKAQTFRFAFVSCKDK